MKQGAVLKHFRHKDWRLGAITCCLEDKGQFLGEQVSFCAPFPPFGASFCTATKSGAIPQQAKKKWRLTSPIWRLRRHSTESKGILAPQAPFWKHRRHFDRLKCLFKRSLRIWAGLHQFSSLSAIQNFSHSIFSVFLCSSLEIQALWQHCLRIHGVYL